MDMTMDRYAKIEQLRAALDDATEYAEEAGLTFVVLILDIIRVELDQSTERGNGDSMPTAKSFGKGS